MPEVKDADFLRLANYMMDNYGINLTKKKHLIQSRLNAILSSGKYKDFTEYVDYITGGSASVEDMRVILNRLTTNHTYFMRESSHFELLKNKLLPELEKKYNSKKSLAIWSAGCSSGQEPYTLTMLLFDYFGDRRKDWNLKLLATDISNHAMTIAKKGSYMEEDLKDVPDSWKTKYMTEKNGVYTVTPEVRSNVVFREFNLMDEIKFKSSFDIIFCRNVMIYFEADVKNALVNRFYEASNDGAYLLIGQSETLDKSSTRYNFVSPATYVKKG